MEFEKKEHPSGVRFASKAQNNRNEPLIEVDVKEGDTLYLKFIRKDTSNTYNLNDLLTRVSCYAKMLGKQHVHLEDDSMFQIEEGCNVRSLMLRAFSNKNGIYYDRGFIPTTAEERASYLQLRETIYNVRIKTVKEIGNDLLQKIGHPGDKAIVSDQLKGIYNEDDNLPFGKWLLQQRCSFYKKLIDLISGLSVELEQGKVNYTSTTTDFLRAFRNYYLINQNLVRDVVCQEGGLQRKPRKTRRKCNQCRMSGKNRRNHRAHYTCRKKRGVCGKLQKHRK